MLALRSGRDSYATTAAYTVRASISKTGMPIITTSNHYSYTLNTAMRVWMRVADDAFAKSEFRSSLGLSVLQPQGPLALLQVREQLELSRGHLHCNCDVASYVCVCVECITRGGKRAAHVTAPTPENRVTLTPGRTSYWPPMSHCRQ